MKKILISLLVLSQLFLPVADAKIYNVGTRTAEISRAVSGLTFGMDFGIGSTTTTGDLAAGSDIITASVTRGTSNPATYYDSTGKIYVNTTSNTLRWSDGYWNSSGWNYNGRQRGIYSEAQGTNLLIRTDGTSSSAGLWTGWTNGNNGVTGTSTVSQVSASDLTTIASSNAQRLQYTGLAGDVNAAATHILRSTITGAGTVVSGDIVTVSAWVKSTGTNCTPKMYLVWINAAGGDISAVSTTITNSTTWKRITLTSTAPANTDKIALRFQFENIDNTDTFDTTVYGPQAEKNNAATSWIPTAASSLTRNADNPSIVAETNIQANIGTVFAKWYIQGVNYSTAQGICRIDATGGYIWMRMNPSTGTTRNSAQWGALSEKIAAYTFTPYTSYVTTVVYDGTNIYGYVNGASNITSTSTNLTSLGSNPFKLGAGSGNSQGLNGVLQQIYIFNTNLSSGDVAKVTAIMNT